MYIYIYVWIHLSLFVYTGGVCIVMYNMHIITATGDPFPRIDGKVGLVLNLSRPTTLTSINTR